MSAPSGLQSREAAIAALVEEIVKHEGAIGEVSIGEFSAGGWYWTLAITQRFGNTADVINRDRQVNAPFEATIIALEASADYDRASKGDAQ